MVHQGFAQDVVWQAVFLMDLTWLKTFYLLFQGESRREPLQVGWAAVGHQALLRIPSLYLKTNKQMNDYVNYIFLMD